MGRLTDKDVIRSKHFDRPGSGRPVSLCSWLSKNLLFVWLSQFCRSLVQSFPLFVISIWAISILVLIERAGPTWLLRSGEGTLVVWKTGSWDSRVPVQWRGNPELGAAFLFRVRYGQLFDAAVFSMGFQLPSIQFTNRPNSVRLYLPYWTLFCAACVARMAVRRRRPRSSFECKACTYDLLGSLSGICPECGTPIPPEQMERIKQAAAKPTSG